MAAFLLDAEDDGQLPTPSDKALVEWTKQSWKSQPKQNNFNERWFITLKILQKNPQTLHPQDSGPAIAPKPLFIFFQAGQECGIIQDSAPFKFQSQLRVIINQLFKQISKNLDMKANKFIVKLLQMMKEFPEIINWSSNGVEMEIRDIERFSVEVHPLYFTTSNYHSFLRQLNMYSFKKMSKRKNAVSFTHSEFRQDNQSRFHHIKRRLQIAQEKEAQSLLSRSKSEMEQNHTALPSVVCGINQELRSTLTLIKKQTTAKGTLLVERLEKILQKSTGSLAVAGRGKAGQSLPTQHFRECVSFCRLEEVMMHRGELYGCEFNFQQGNFNHPLYFED